MKLSISHIFEQQFDADDSEDQIGHLFHAWAVEARVACRADNCPRAEDGGAQECQVGRVRACNREIPGNQQDEPSSGSDRSEQVKEKGKELLAEWVTVPLSNRGKGEK